MYQKFDRPQQYTYKQQDPQYNGQPLDRQLANGPQQQNRIRDCLFCILYILFMAAMVVVAIIAFSKGQPHLLAAPFDSAGFQCGYSYGYEHYPYGYYMPTNHSKFVCISACPTKAAPSANCIWNNTVYSNCQGIGISPTIKIVNFCYPESQTMNQFADLGLGFFEKGMSDLNTSWPIALSVLFISLALSIVFLFFIRACGGCLVWTVIVLYFAVIITFGVVAFLSAQNKININGIDQLNDPELLRTISYVCWGVAAVSLLILLCSIGKLRIATAVIKTTAEFTQQKCQTILVPVFMFFAVSVFFTLWIVVSIYIFSAGQVSQCKGTPYACIDWDVGVKRSLAFYLFGLFWQIFFINKRNCEIAIGMCQFVIASTCAYWYFSHLNRDDDSSPVCRSFCRGMVYHFGSICLGALVLTILRLLQLILEFLHYSAKSKTLSADPGTNACLSCAIKFLRCCIACFERFIRFITRNAIIMMAITGEGFCTSAHQAFYLILRSGRQYAITHGVGYLIMLFGKLCIALACTFIGYLMVSHIDTFSENMYSPFLPTVLFFVISFVVASLFMDVFAVGSDTILLCYCLEMDVLRGMSYACPEELKHVMTQYQR